MALLVVTHYSRYCCKPVVSYMYLLMWPKSDELMLRSALLKILVLHRKKRYVQDSAYPRRSGDEFRWKPKQAST